MEFEPLKGWENFYVVTGSAGAGLTGLTFVVIALVRDARNVNPAGLGAFVSPTIVHFTAVLTLAAFLCIPRMSALALEIGLSTFGIAGLLYVASITWKIIHRVSDYLPVLEDWVFNVILPAVCYGVLLATGLIVAARPEVALYGVAAASVLLLVTGIHNAWDIAVWMSLRTQQAAGKEGARAQGSGPAPAGAGQQPGTARPAGGGQDSTAAEPPA